MLDLAKAKYFIIKSKEPEAKGDYHIATFVKDEDKVIFYTFRISHPDEDMITIFQPAYDGIYDPEDSIGLSLIMGDNSWKYFDAGTTILSLGVLNIGISKILVDYYGANINGSAFLNIYNRFDECVEITDFVDEEFKQRVINYIKDSKIDDNGEYNWRKRMISNMDQ